MTDEIKKLREKAAHIIANESPKYSGYPDHFATALEAFDAAWEIAEKEITELRTEVERLHIFEREVYNGKANAKIVSAFIEQRNFWKEWCERLEQCLLEFGNTDTAFTYIELVQMACEVLHDFRKAKKEQG
jgi:hypothetical protein